MIKETVTKDLWIHIGGLIAIAIGLFGDRYLALGLGSIMQLAFIFGGLAFLGVRLTNGVASSVNTATTAAAVTVANAVAEAAAKAVRDTATATAQAVKDTAATAAGTTPKV